jgi:hypothetical protein
LAKFKGKRFDMGNLHARLLESPPMRIGQYKHKDEIINYVLDKAFVEMPIKEELLISMQQCLANKENREYLLRLLENDYKGYGLSYLKP